MYHIEEEVVYMAKAYLNVAIGNEKRRFGNDALDHRQLINWIKQMPAKVQVICEQIEPSSDHANQKADRTTRSARSRAD
jgi:hypothetical protein